jgi:ABC-type Fe3+/spermidine/putrescine transport system ATPase subunit
MTRLKVFAATAILPMMIATPVFAQAAVQEPGLYAFYHPDGDVLEANRRWPRQPAGAMASVPSGNDAYASMDSNRNTSSCALDAQLRDAMQIELRRMLRRLGVTTVFVTHDQHEAFTMSDRVAVVSAGELQQFDTPSAIYNRPKTPFVAEFIGQVNCFEGTFRGCEGRGTVALEGRDEPILAEMNGDDIPPGNRVQVMVRPERIVVALAGVSPGRNTQSGIVSDIVFSGEKVSIFIDTAIGPMEVHQFSASTKNGTSIAIGQPLVVTWDPVDTMVFRAR